jgi:hypothetical protein
LYTRDKYEPAVAAVRRFKELRRLNPDLSTRSAITLLRPTKQDYHCIRRFDIVEFANKTFLIMKPSDSKAVITVSPPGTTDSSPLLASFDEVFKIISRSHKEAGHVASENTWRWVRKFRANISRKVCALYVSMCPICLSRVKIPKRPRGSINYKQLYHCIIIFIHTFLLLRYRISCHFI